MCLTQRFFICSSQIYTDWANHYLAKSGHKRLIKDLQQDVSDGVLLAEIIQVIVVSCERKAFSQLLRGWSGGAGVGWAHRDSGWGACRHPQESPRAVASQQALKHTNEKIEDINGCPKSRSQMIENIDACLSFLAAKGVNIQGLSAEEIRNGNLKAILGLFFSLSRYKQQQQTSRQTQHTHAHTPVCQQSSAPAQLTSTSHGTHVHPPQTEMQSRDGSQSKLKFSIGQKKSSRLPGPSSRVCTAGSESSPRSSITSAGNRRSLVFSDKSKPAAAQAKESSESVSLHTLTDHGPSSLASSCTSVNTSTVTSSAIPHPNSSSKPWKSKTQGNKQAMATSMVLSSKTDLHNKQPAPAEPPPKVVPQKSMLEKLKLFNSKGSSKSSAQTEGAVSPTGGKDGGCFLEKVETGSNTEPFEEMEGNVRPSNGSSVITMTTSSPKIALKGIAQRTFSRALTAKKASTKAVEKEKEKEGGKEKGKNGKEGFKRITSSDKVDTKKDIEEEVIPSIVLPSSEAEPRKASKITSFIPKGSKVGGTKKDGSALVQSGIPKPGSKSTGNGAFKSSALPLSAKDNERPRSMRLGGLHRDSRHSSSSSSLASTEGKGHQTHNTVPVANGTQSTASNTVSVQLPQPQQQYNHPNTATVAPFMYRSQNEVDGNIGSNLNSGCHVSDSSNFSKINQSSTEDLSETRRLRTVKNIADLRQNLEETMSSLRGTQITHSTLETTFDSGVTTEMSSRNILSLASRPSPLSWASRMGQSSPRLQAGDAPSLGNGYQSRSGGLASGQGRYLYQAPLRKQLASRSSALGGLELAERVEDLELTAVGLEMSGYMSDGDVLTKNPRTDELNSGYMTDGGLSLYTRRLNRLPDGMAMVREGLQRNTSTGQGDADSWDDSSSVSSGISDAIDTDDINTSSSISSYTTAAPRKVNGQPQTDAEKHSAAERTNTCSLEELKKFDGGSDCGIRMDSVMKWRRNTSDGMEEFEKSSSGRKTAAISQTGSWRRGMSAQVGVTSPRTKSSTVNSGTSAVKTQVTGKTDDAKVSEKGSLSPCPNTVQHSSSDTGRSSGDESKKTTPGRVPTSTFGFKKPNGMLSPTPVMTTTSITLVTASGATITSGSATLGKIPKSSAPLVGNRASIKSAVDGLLPSHEDPYLSASARSNLQYRSLPRPSRSGAAARNGNRSSISSIESSLITRAPILTAITTNKSRDPTHKTNGHIIQANQTDKEKGVASELDNSRTNPVVSGGGAATIPQTTRQGNKYSEVSSPTLRRLFGGKTAKQAPVTTAESMKNSVVISNPHATLGHTQLCGGPLDSPSTVPGSECSSPLYGGRGASIGGSEQASSPGSVYSTGTGTWGTTISSSSALGYPSVSSMHTSSESIDMSVGSGHHREDIHPVLMRTGSAKIGMPESPLSSPSASPKFNRNTLPRKQDRYAPSSHLRQEEARDWLRSHSAGGLQDSASNSPFSTGSSLTSPSGTRFNFAQLGSPTSGAQMNLTSLRNNSLSGQENPLENHGDSRLRNSCMSLDDKTRTMSRSGSFRDGFEEVHGSSLSLVSSASSVYSTTEEKSQSEIRKLRRELDASQEKVSALTTQLSANVSEHIYRLSDSELSMEEQRSSSDVCSDRISHLVWVPLNRYPSNGCKVKENDKSRQGAFTEDDGRILETLECEAHLVAAFEQSLGNMTIRLKSLTMTAEQKDSELNELRKTIELLKKQNAVAQAAINGVINTPELTCKSERTGGCIPGSHPELRIRRQHSSDSVSSITSATSHSSLGSNVDNPESCSKKKKKNWMVSCAGGHMSDEDYESEYVSEHLSSSCHFLLLLQLRSSFKQAFSKKKSPKSASSHSDIEEMMDSSLPSSPKLPHNGSGSTPMLLRNTHSSSILSDCLDGEAETVLQLRNELREKEMKLTDIRLEALSSAHQLDQLREAMNRMQVEIEKLKSENDRLKLESQASGSRTSSQVSVYNPTPTPTATPVPGLSQHSLNLTESNSLDMLLDDSAGDGSSRKESRHVKIVVSLQENVAWKEESRTREFLIGCIGVSGKTKWDVLDGVVRRLFKILGAHTPELLPCGYLVGENDTINISLKGANSQYQDSLVFETLIPKPVLQRYISLLQEHRRIILSGPSGTGKSFLAHRLAEHLAQQEGRLPDDSSIVTFNIDHKSSKELRQYLLNVVEQCSADGQESEAPLVLILDNLHHISSLGEIFSGLLNCRYQRCPYIIGTMSQATSSAPNLQLHHNFRWVLCANHMEPVKGFLGRFLRRKLIETEISCRSRSPELLKIIDWIPQVWQHLNRFLEAHSSSDVTIGPRLFLSCPMDVDGSRVWFTDLWNYSIIPYMLEAVREGLQLYGRRAAWEDPALWVLETFPWAASHQHPDWPALLQLRPEDVGFDGYSASREGLNKQSTQSDSDADPLMNMLLRLKEAASCSSPQSYDSDSTSNSHHDDILDSSLESTL
ncbi:hypothetical protein DNTS_028222 [Danionella cerebrum]|uniref:Calponin-homology (CH) domain-containing protein n=1 Tax=Danionella cerebrum TaxID=2873325 RepID=A0A553QNZ7_9TELE|nr:hypothetical protein DNTS_028222 [Danionella translucida]TRY91448.1 hypothetical protein DNTS_028222 [Danionella translucida]